MTKEITKAYILQQIQDKFKLRELAPEIFRFSEEVIPTYDIAQHLVKWNVVNEQKTVTGMGSVHVHTVPQYERWTLRAYMTIFLSGVFTIAGTYVTHRPSALANYIYLDLKAAQNVAYLVTLPTPVVLDSGTQIRVNVDGYTSSGDFQHYIDIQREELR